MKIKITKSHLLLGLQRVQNVSERKTNMPILYNCLLKTQAPGLTLAATDLEVGIQSFLPAEVLEEGALTVKARSLLEIVRELPDTEIVLNAHEGNRLEMTAKKSVFHIVGLPAEDYPQIPGFGNEDGTPFMRMNGTVVIMMLDKTLYAASNDEARYHLNGVFFETIEEKNKKMLRMVATDAHRLSLVDTSDALFEENAWGLFGEGIIVPRKGLNELRRLLAEGKEDFFLKVKDRMLLIKRDNLFLSMRLIDSKYADYRRIIPEPLSKPLELRREDFLASLKRISLMSSDKSRSVTLSLLPGVLQLSSQSPELGDATEEINLDYEGEEFKIGFNSRYLIDAISAMDGEKVFLELRGRQYPGVVRSDTDYAHTSVVMPMRI